MENWGKNRGAADGLERSAAAAAANQRHRGESCG